MARRPSPSTRARAAPDSRNRTPPLRPVQQPPARDSSRMGWRPNAARRSSTTWTLAGPSSASTRRNTTARCGSAGMASASRHSATPEPTQRLRQMSVPGS